MRLLGSKVIPEEDEPFLCMTTLCVFDNKIDEQQTRWATFKNEIPCFRSLGSGCVRRRCSESDASFTHRKYRGEYFGRRRVNRYFLVTAPPADVRCEKPESVVVTHVPRARTSCSWKHEGEEPADFRFEATLPSGLVTVQEGIVGKSTEVDLQCFQNYGIIVYARYVRPNGTEYLASSKEIAVSSGECGERDDHTEQMVCQDRNRHLLSTS